ncbi:Hypothetical protein Y17_0908 [Pectobacterium wasabiae CFBP 3304]|nr:Hypothetical protein Y17_0908 [Pectobacterium wasabiae CFBP 3304]
MRSLAMQVRTASLRTVIACVIKHPPITTPCVFLPIDLNDIDNYSQMIFHGL